MSEHGEADPTTDPEAEDPQAALELLRDLSMDLRAELPRIDTRAAASLAISGAVLLGAVQLTPSRMPAFAFGAAGCVFMTVSLILSFSVLLPSRPGGPAAGWAGFDDPASLVAELRNWDRQRYYAAAVLDLANVARVRSRRLRSALLMAAIAVFALAFGAALDILRG